MTRLLIIISITLTILLGKVGYDRFMLCQKDIYEQTETTFKEAINTEREKMKNNVPIYSTFNSLSSTDPIPISEREMHSDQEYLTKKDPNRHTLDSLLCLKLKRQGIHVRCAIRCISKFGVSNSHSDSQFYKRAVLLEPVIYRPLENRGRVQLKLQAYVQIPFLFVVKQIPGLGLMLFLWILINGAMWSIYLIWPRYKSRLLAKNKTVVIQTVSEIREIETIKEVETVKTEKKAVMVKSFSRKGVLPYDLQFDKNSGILSRNGDFVQLSKQKLHLFCCLLNEKESVTTYETISYIVLKKKKFEPAIQPAISMAIKRLRKELAPFPFIKIISCPSQGYQLVFEEPEMKHL